MKLTICSLITRSSVSILSYSISAWSVITLLCCVVIFLSSHTQSVLSWQTNQMEKFCSCGLQVPQQKFCEHDFVIAGKRVNRIIGLFNQKSGRQISSLLPYRGQIYRIRITFNFKGVYIKYNSQKVFVTVYVIKGFFCGVPDNVDLKRHKNYVISGYKYKKMLIITSCNWLQSLSNITSIQAIGLFSNLYQNYCLFSDKCQITFHYKSSIHLDNSCNIKTTFKECYDKYAICQLQSNNKCGILTDPESLSNKSLVNQFPKPLRRKYEREQKLYINHFNICVRIRINNGPRK